MKKVLAVAAVLLTFSTSAFAAPPPGAFSGHPHHSHISSSHRVHVGPPHPMHTPTGNRVRMTPTHGWRYAGYYARPYGYRAVWYGYPVPYYYRYPYGVYYRRYYASPGIHISVRL